MEPAQHKVEVANKELLKNAMEDLLSQDRPIFLIAWVDKTGELSASVGGTVMDAMQIYPRMGAMVSAMLDEARKAQPNVQPN